MSFSSIPIVDFQRLQDPNTKDEALGQLRDAIFGVGFLYLINHGLEVSCSLPLADSDSPCTGPDKEGSCQIARAVWSSSGYQGEMQHDQLSIISGLYPLGSGNDCFKN